MADRSSSGRRPDLVRLREERRVGVGHLSRAYRKLVVGVTIPYTPNEFKDSDGNIVGFDVVMRGCHD